MGPHGSQEVRASLDSRSVPLGPSPACDSVKHEHLARPDRAHRRSGELLKLICCQPGWIVRVCIKAHLDRRESMGERNEEEAHHDLAGCDTSS